MSHVCVPAGPHSALRADVTHRSVDHVCFFGDRFSCIFPLFQPFFVVADTSMLDSLMLHLALGSH